MTREEIKDAMVAMGEKSFRGDQIFQWVQRGVTNLDDMTDISKPFREKLASAAYIGSLTAITKQEDPQSGTKKFLFGLGDGNRIESVFMRYKYGNSLCVSSQAGCRMGCEFCASTLAGLARNLSAGEMVDQIICAQRETGEHIGHIVVMGIGEPLDNYDNLSKFINIINDKKGLNIGMRNITVSTCGIVPMIERIGRDFPQVNLAISLHAPNDELRSSMMPINKRYPIGELMRACKKHTEATGRRLTFEYALASGVNDGDKTIDELIKLLRGNLCHVNLIPLNEIKEKTMTGSAAQRVERIRERLEKAGVTATVRRELGAKIEGACGQLRLGGEK